MTMRNAWILSLTLTLIGGLSLPLSAADECCPTDGPATAGAAGQSGMTGMGGAAGLPPGHPPMGQAKSGQLPPGHPPMDGMSGQLPPGHPAVHGTRSEPFTASLTVRTQQGTADAAAPAGAKVQIAFHGRQGIVRQLDTELDDQGRLTLEDLSFQEAVQPVVRLEYGGVSYQGVGHVISSTQPDSAVRIVVYEAQAEAVEMDVPMRHVMLQMTEDGLHVTEIYAIRNTTDRTWIGQPLEGVAAETASVGEGGHAKPTRSTVVLPLSSGAGHVALGHGFDTCCTRIEADRVVVTTPLPPGTHQFQFSYTLPLAAGKAELDLTSAVAVRHLGVFAPESGMRIEATGLTAGDAMDNGGQRIRSYSATQLKPGQAAGVSVTLVSGQAAAVGGAAVPPGSSSNRKMIVGLGAAALVGAGLVMLFRPRQAPAPAAPALANPHGNVS